MNLARMTKGALQSRTIAKLNGRGGTGICRKESTFSCNQTLKCERETFSEKSFAGRRRGLCQDGRRDVGLFLAGKKFQEWGGQRRRKEGTYLGVRNSVWGRKVEKRGEDSNKGRLLLFSEECGGITSNRAARGRRKRVVGGGGTIDAAERGEKNEKIITRGRRGGKRPFAR